MSKKNLARRKLGTIAFLSALSFTVATACTGDDGDQGPPGPPGPSGDTDTDTELSQGDELPGLDVEVQSITGGSASGGRFNVGDRPSVNFRLRKSDGSDWDLTELNAGRAILSGPTFNYQRVILEVTDLLTASVKQADGSYTYTYATPIPATYAPPINDSPAFDIEDGELAGEDLLEGTYTVGLTFSWDFTVDGESERDSGNATVDFVLGNSGVVEPREAVKIENCNRCHEQLRIHGGRREDARLCVLCHTSGAEDDSGTGVSIDFKVMIHKIHAGSHLPSVLGVATNLDGTRNYLATPTPYVVSGNDFSDVPFPAWPHGLVPTPRDTGYTLLSSANKTTEDTIRKGPSNCVVCHGDPDHDGPLTAPAQGDLYMTQPTRQACGSCHDDVSWGQPYNANEQTMGPQADNANCKLCHAPSGDPISVFDAHLHPLLDPALDTGLNFEVTDLVEAGTHNNDGTLDPDEKIRFTLRITDDAGAELNPTTIASLASPSLVISGPTSNYNLLLNTSIPIDALTGPQPFTLNAPMQVDLERLGVSTNALESFTTDFTPHWTSAPTSVLVRTGNSTGNSTLSADTVAPQNYVDVGNPAGFARDATVVVGDGLANAEYAKIQFVEGNRLWFSSPYTTSYKAGLVSAHGAGAIVRGVTLSTKTEGVDYTLNAASGTITELVEFGSNATVLASYRTDFVLPQTYPLSLNDSPDLDDSSGKWAGKPLVDGTYTLGVWSSRSFDVTVGTTTPETTTYRLTADSENVDFLVGSAGVVEPYDLIASGSSCFNCHQELAFHGFGRRGFDSCVLCHGTAGSEDRPQYVAGNAPDTSGLTVSFRTMLHKIHMGEELANASSYDVVGFGSSSYPNNFGLTNFAEVVFPALPGGTANCAKCHGNDAWHEPRPREHPTDQDAPIRRWAAVCGACHDSTDAQAHIRVQTDSLGNESCGVCHGEDGEWGVQRMHKPY